MFKDKIALVTGASSGIGLATTKAFIDNGAFVLLLDTSKPIETIENSKFFQIDVSDPESVRTTFSQIEKKFSKIDFAFNAAGIGGAFAPVEDYPIDDWYHVMNVNLNAVFLCMKFEIPLMRNAGGGSIVNCASLLADVGFANDSAYVSSKHAVIGLTKSAAMEYATSNIRINAVSPGFVNTPMTKNYSTEKRNQIASMHPMNRFAEPNEIANAVIWLCSADSSFVCGHNLKVDGGYTIQ